MIRTESAGVGASEALRVAGELTAPDAGKKNEVGFESAMVNAIDKVNEHGVFAEQAAKAFAEGKLDDIHGTMIAARRADIELKLLSNVRTKVVDTINDLLRMNV